MSTLSIILLVWLGSAMLVIVAGLRISTRTGSDRYVVMRVIEPEEPRTDEAPQYRKAA